MLEEKKMPKADAKLQPSKEERIEMIQAIRK